jgi:hypothetical protein
MRKRKPRPYNPQEITEEALGENVRSACEQLGWKLYWLRKTMFGAKGILDCLIVPVRTVTHLSEGVLVSRHILHRELKGFDARGRLGKLTPDQAEAIELINAAGGDAALWVPADWFSDRILKELR